MKKAALFALSALTAGYALVVPAQAQSCNDLWYRRNAIYAEAGYCFQTQRARAVFGRGCFPPYGRLSPYQQQMVNDIQRQEDYMGCPR